MRSTLLVALMGATACLDHRTEALARDIGRLTRESEELRQQALALHTALDKAIPQTQSVRMDLDPEGFDLTRPLPKGSPSRPDVILLSIDTLRADHLGTYGYKQASGRDTSPFIDSLANSGTVYEQAYSPTSWTLPSHTTMLSGQLPDNHGIIDDHLRIADDIPMVQEAFHAAGYGTSGAVATLFVSSRFGFDRGFDHFEDFGVKNKATNNLSTVDADHVFHTTLHWAQRQPHGKPLFAFLHVYDAHYGYDAPPPYNEMFDRPPTWDDEKYKKYHYYLRKGLPNAEQMQHQVAQYDEEIRFIDAMFEELVTTWRASGRDLIVVVTADHGEEFGERESWGHGHTLFPEQTRVPLVIHGAGVRTQRVAERIGTEDIAATLAELAGVSFVAPDGASRASQARRGGPGPRAPSAEIAASYRFETNTIRYHKAPWDLTLDLHANTRMLCRIDTDPGCMTMVTNDNQALTDSLFADWRKERGTPWTASMAGTVRVKKGVIFKATDRYDGQISVQPGDTLDIVPGDAIVDFKDEAGNLFGPWQALGGSVPGRGCPMTYRGRFLTNARLGERTDQERQMLIDLGYLQNEEDDAITPSGPVDCEPQ